MNENQIEKLHGLLKDFSTVMLVTMDDGESHARPMAVAHVDENTDLWLFTSRDSAKVREIKADTRVQVLGQEGWANCVVLAGHAQVVDDRAKIRELWKPALKAWFPDGAEDQNIMLLYIKGERAEYWDSTGMNRFSYLYQTIKAVATGTTPKIREGDQHGTVTLAQPVRAAVDPSI
ncbi:MAG: pyridoxamine 5'-phosphate oxidase family protein [Undibacterium sp.]|nr:pyridoxamine 5'-phosphate oxidase family protein [Opitutaceae bacterium]